MAVESIRRIIAELAGIPNRGAGTPGEREAADQVRTEFETLGLDVSTQVFLAPKILGHPVSLFLLLSLASVAIGLSYPFPGAILGALCFIFLRRMFNLQGDLWARMVPRGESINVIGTRLAAGAKRSLVLSAHIDAGQTGWMFHPGVKKLFARFHGDPKSVQGPMYLPAMVLLGAVILMLIQSVGGSGVVVETLHLVVLGFLVVSLIVTIQWMRSPIVPGAIDNASGVAAMIEAALDLTDNPLKETNLYLVATGAEETGMMGMKYFFKTHRETLTDPPTFFINFESVGGGELKVVEEEGELGRFRYPPFLVGFSQFVSKKHGLGTLLSVNLLAGTDAVVTAREGLPTLCLIALDEQGVPPNYHEMADTADRTDFDVTLRAAHLAVAVARELENEGL